MPYITHRNGQTTHYLDDNFTDPWNPCEAILIQHGFARSAAFWYHWIPALSRHYRVIRRDARGHGKSSAPQDSDSYDYSVDEILFEIIDTLDQLGLHKVHYLGESTGGIFGEALAVKYPQRLLSLTVCSSPMYLPQSAQDMLAFGHSSWPAACRALGSRGWGIECAKVLGADQFADKYYLKWWVEQVAVADGKGLGDHAELLAKTDARTFVENINVPMLILAPANSQMVKVDGPDGQEELHRKVRGSELVVVEGKGHEIYVDEAEKCQKAFLNFLSELQLARSPLRRFSSASAEAWIR